MDMAGREIPSAYKIRPMEESDLETVAQLEAAVFSDPWSLNLYRETLLGGRCVCLVLEVPDGTDTVAGYFCGQIVLDEAEVHRIAVSPAFRGRKYGQALLEAFFARAQADGAASVLLEVRESNRPAIGLYEKNGFRQLGLRKGYYQKPTEDARIYRKIF